jgi:hypothetical protein
MRKIPLSILLIKADPVSRIGFFTLCESSAILIVLKRLFSYILDFAESRNLPTFSPK